MSSMHHSKRLRGFSLVEVMVALIVIAFGMLGIAKIEALALSSTSVASTRSLAAIEAASLATSMHADRAYWAAGLAPATIAITAGATISDKTLAKAPGCGMGVGNACAAAQMAAFDLQNWATDLQAVLPAAQATISCTTAGLPVTCTVDIVWAENALAVSANPTVAASAMQQPQYTLYVEP
jgi:type IV pilus assembly protein PilV